MEDAAGGDIGKLSKKLAERGVVPGEEVDYKTKAGTAWSHNFLNQKPWHPLSYPNQRRKWIAEQTHANRARRTDEVAREFAQEQEFFQRTALFSKKEKEKVEMMKAVSFMYVRPPGYNPESAKAAEVADEKRRLDPNTATHDPTNNISPERPDTKPDKSQIGEEKKKARPKDVFGRTLPTGEEFEALKNAPRLETGLPVRDKPFGIEIRNVRCLRCSNYGHQSGDRECPLKDAIMPNEESRLKRDDPLTLIKVHEDSGEPLKWELKQKPGMSPPRGGFQADDPNQQIVAEEIFDEYGGFLSGGDIPALLTNFKTIKCKKHTNHKSKHKRHHGSKVRHANYSSSDSEAEREKRSKSTSKHKKKKHRHSKPSISDSSDSHHESKVRHANYLSSDSEAEKLKSKSTRKHKKKKHRHSDPSISDSSDSHHDSTVRHATYSSFNSKAEREKRTESTSKHKNKNLRHSDPGTSDNSDSHYRGRHRQDSYHSASGFSDSHHRHRRRKHRNDSSSEPDVPDLRSHRHRRKR